MARIETRNTKVKKLFFYNDIVVELRDSELETVLRCYQLDENKKPCDMCDLFELNKIVYQKNLTDEVSRIYNIDRGEFNVKMGQLHNAYMDFESFIRFKLYGLMNLHLQLTPEHLAQIPLLYNTLTHERKIWDLISDMFLHQVSPIVYTFIEETVGNLVTYLHTKSV